jgi:hypothetical protein
VANLEREQPSTGPTRLSWLQQFEIALKSECFERLGELWRVKVDVEKKEIRAQGPARNERVIVQLHPGSHGVTPAWAAHRYADQLQLAAVTRGFISSPRGAAVGDTSA